MTRSRAGAHAAPTELAATSFVRLSIAFGVVAFRNWFRFYSVATIVILIVLPTVAFSYVPAAGANQATPSLGLTERSSSTPINSGTPCWPLCYSEARVSPLSNREDR